MGINLIESIRGEQIFEYKFPDFLDDSNKIGDSANDFEVLQVLGSGAFGNVLKVKSKKNLEIYAMKKVNKHMLKGTKDEKYYLNEKIILPQLKSPLVCRCLTIFEDQDYIYYVMEYMNNGDLKSYFYANDYLESQIPEERLWDLYFKCISGLLYVHKKGIIHRDIKLDNLFLDDNFNIKIGDFNISAALDQKSAENFTNDVNQTKSMICTYTYLGTPEYIAPELMVPDNQRRYDQKADVYSMGIAFFVLAYGMFPYRNNIDRREKYYSKNVYSDELNEIIDKMIQRDPNKRYTSEEAYSIIKNIYIEKYVKNSAVNSSLSCFNSFKNFREFFLNEYNKNILFKNKPSNKKSLEDIKVQMGYSVFHSIQSLEGENDAKINSNLFDLRKNMENYGLNAKYNEEIKIGKFIFIFLKILNSIFNEVVTDENDKEKMKEIDRELGYLSSTYSFENGQEYKAFIKINEVYNKRMLSLISRNFISFVQTKKKCMNCYNERNYFSMINYIPFNVDILTKNCIKNNFHIKDGFKYLLNDEKTFNEQKGIVCKKCKKATVHKESKSFYYTAKNVIIILNRGENCENKTFIDFDEQLEIINNKPYQLTGIIELNEVGEYISFTRNENNKWNYNGHKNNTMPFSVIKNLGTVVSLFYYCNDDSMVLQSDSSFVQQFNNVSLSQRNVNINPSNLINNNNNINNASYNRSQTNNYSNNTNNLNMNYSYNSGNFNPMNNMGQQNINYPYPNNNMNQFAMQNNINYINNANINYFNMPGANFIGQMNMNYMNNNQINNFQGGNLPNYNYNNNNFH